jgi:RNA polymerase sigma-70 factor (ECF subfamily)
MSTVRDFIPGQTDAATGARRNHAHLSDEALLALCSRADESALGELRDRSLAEDAVQEAFLAVWRSAGAFLAEHGKPSTWILTLVHRRAVDLVRREERRRADPLDDVEQPTGEATDEEAWLRAQRQVVQEALRKLPPEQREAIELAYYGGFTQSELAEKLGQPLGTIKSRMFAGLKRLRELLAEAGLDVDAP